jgi:hypothetical protein
LAIFRTKTKALQFLAQPQLLVQVPLAASAQTQLTVPRLEVRGQESRPVVVEPPLHQPEVSLGQVVVCLVVVETRIRLRRLPLELEQVEQVVSLAVDRYSQVRTRLTPSLWNRLTQVLLSKSCDKHRVYGACHGGWIIRKYKYEPKYFGDDGRTKSIWQ